MRIEAAAHAICSLWQRSTLLSSQDSCKSKDNVWEFVGSAGFWNTSIL